MKKARILLALGIWVAILPYLGFPNYWKSILFTITGLYLILLAYDLYRENKKKLNKSEEKVFDNFLENKDFNENPINTDENENNFN
jgi:membrane protein implicated in regulation of membrane protease activity